MQVVIDTGSKDVEITCETTIPVVEWFNGPRIKAAMGKLNISLVKAKEIFGSVIRIKLKG